MQPHEIKALRIERNMSQQDLAAKLGIDQATVSRIENDTLAPSRPVLRLLDVWKDEKPVKARRASREGATL